MPGPGPRTRLAPVARAQFGVFHLAQAAEVDVSRTAVGRLREAGELSGLFPGVYAFELFPDSWERRAMAAQLASGEDAALSHWAAARILDLPYLPIRRSPRIELTVPRGKRRWKLPLRIHESTRIRPIEVVEAGPFRVTSPEWTLCALSHRLGLTRFERAMDGAIAKGRTTLERMATTGRRFDWCNGRPAIRAALARHIPQSRGTRSQRERWFLRLLRDAGLPLPEANVRVVDAAGRVRYLDFAWRRSRICVEIDADPLHRTPIGRNEDGSRQNDLVPDWTPLRFDEWDLRYAPERIIAQLRRMLEAAGASAPN